LDADRWGSTLPFSEGQPALQGMRVLDLGGERGAFCGKLLADMGADVVKVEPPGGDPGRKVGPFLGGAVHPEKSLSFWYSNTSKRGITLDIESRRGQEILRDLARTADVVLEGFSPGYLRELTLDYAALVRTNARLTVTSISNFGQTGPRRDYASCDIVSSALGGQMHVCGDADTPPLTPYGEQACLVASLFGAIGTLMALYHRHSSGRGQHVDISMHECVAGVIEHVNMRHFFEGVVAKRQGSLHWDNAFRVFPCRDGHVLLSLFREWDTVVEWLDSEGMAADLKEERWREPEVRRMQVEHVIDVLESWTRMHAAAELMEQGQRMHLPWAVVHSIRDLKGNPQMLERGFFVEVAHPEDGASFSYPGAPYVASRTPWRIWKRAPLIGEHNEEILVGELGLSLAEMARLHREEII
jgi:benzylsuccinate CoA-transferase BbsE subunit